MVDIYTTHDPEDYVKQVYADLAGDEGILIHVGDDICIWTGREPSLNLDEVHKRNIYVGVGQRPGGTIVNMKGDITVCFTKRGPIDLTTKISAAFVEYLKGRKKPKLTVTTDKNDVLVNGKKIMSWAGDTMANGFTQHHMHFSVGPIDMELIEAICTKPMVKIPGSLEEFGMTSDVIYKWVCDTINELA